MAWGGRGSRPLPPPLLPAGRLGLACLLVAVTSLPGCCSTCQKITRVSEVSLLGYKTQPIYTNACMVTARALVMPVTDGRPGDSLYIKQYHDDCCCSVQNSSTQTVYLESVDGRNFREISYTRIEACACTRCRPGLELTQDMNTQYIG